MSLTGEDARRFNNGKLPYTIEQKQVIEKCDQKILEALFAKKEFAHCEASQHLVDNLNQRGFIAKYYSTWDPDRDNTNAVDSTYVKWFN